MPKLCPLNKDKSLKGFYECQEGFCAWWDKLDGCCVVKSLRYELMNIVGAIRGEK